MVTFCTQDGKVKLLVKFLAINRNWNGIWRANCDFMEVSFPASSHHRVSSLTKVFSLWQRSASINDMSFGHFGIFRQRLMVTWLVSGL